MLHRITSATPRPDFSVELEWDGQTVATVDLSDFVRDGEVTVPLRDPAYFVEELRVGGGGDWIGWPGEVDIDADALWYQAHPADLQRDYGITGSAAE